MLPGAVGEEIADEQIPPLPSLMLAVHSLLVLGTDIAIPHSDSDIRADLELPHIKDFLITAQKPANMDDTIFQKFVKCVSRIFVKNEQLW